MFDATRLLIDIQGTLEYFILNRTPSWRGIGRRRTIVVSSTPKVKDSFTKFYVHPPTKWLCVEQDLIQVFSALIAKYNLFRYFGDDSAVHLLSITWRFTSHDESVVSHIPIVSLAGNVV